MTSGRSGDGSSSARGAVSQPPSPKLSAHKRTVSRDSANMQSVVVKFGEITVIADQEPSSSPVAEQVVIDAVPIPKIQSAAAISAANAAFLVSIREERKVHDSRIHESHFRIFDRAQKAALLSLTNVSAVATTSTTPRGSKGGKK